MQTHLHDETDMKIYVPGSLNAAAAGKEDSGSDAQMLLWKPGAAAEQTDAKPSDTSL